MDSYLLRRVKSVRNWVTASSGVAQEVTRRMQVLLSFMGYCTSYS